MARNSSVLQGPPDQLQRMMALDPARSILVQAPAGSGKTDLLTRRFLRLLATVDDPKHIVAITFTRAAAAEMRDRILSELEKAAVRPDEGSTADESSMEALATRALERSHQLNWRLLDLTPQLRISTIDSFCRDLAVQQPIYSGIGNNLQISERPSSLYRMAARATLEKLGNPHYADLGEAITELLLWRDNNWKELEDLLVKMLGQRDRWMQDFVLSRRPDWNALRLQLELPLAKAVRRALDHVASLLGSETCNEAHELAQFACEHGATELHRDLAERAEFPHGPYDDNVSLEDARAAFLCVANLLLNGDGEFRQRIDRRLGFPKEHLDQKLRLEDMIDRLSNSDGLREALVALRDLPPARYTEDDWRIIRASFMLLRHAAAELKAVFAEAGTVDFVEVAQIAKSVLRGDDNLPSDAAQAVADDIHHLLVDEFQDTSRRQHEFITALIEAWPDNSGRTIFVVGDPMQSIYFFRDAEAELFTRVKENGFELVTGDAFAVHPVTLSANFRTEPMLINELNSAFHSIFAQPDGSRIEFERAEPARQPGRDHPRPLQLHLEFVQRAERGNTADAESREAADAAQIAKILAIVSSHQEEMDNARAAGKKYRVAILGRARTALAPIAAALRVAGVPFRAVELESLKDRPEILDAVALARALMNPEDRVAWLGVLRAPWCGLSLAELHSIAGVDGPQASTEPIPDLLRSRLHLLTPESRKPAQRVLDAFASIPHLRATLPTATAGTLLQSLWRALGGESCVDDNPRANLHLFWQLVDNLPEGEQDLAGPALDAALEDLCALPDPLTSSECGVQLMTIHKSKGLEFEVVIVPDLQARDGASKPELLSWLERGIADPDDPGALTEFLIAPLQFKGADPGTARSWVERMRRQREQQEARRILYVAATRAREELHLFAQLTYKTGGDGALNLVEPSNCLLSTAWPAFADDIRARFEQWRSGKTECAELVVPAIAAAANNVIEMPSPAIPTMIRRLPPDFELRSAMHETAVNAGTVVGLGDTTAYQRHEGGLLSRALGNAVHKLLEELARLRASYEWEEARRRITDTHPRIVSLIRATGITASECEQLSARAVEIALDASRDKYGEWILSPHPDAASESDWAGIVDGKLRSVRVDRIFRAGLEPFQPGDDVFWIIDYKTAHPENLNDSTLQQLRRNFAPQLKAYADVLKHIYGTTTKLRASLYYPLAHAFDWWEI